MFVFISFRSSNSPVRNIQNDSPVKSNRKNNKKRILDDSSDEDVVDNKENGVAQNKEETKVADSSASNDQGAPPKRKTGLSIDKIVKRLPLQSFKISNIIHTNSRTSFYSTLLFFECILRSLYAKDSKHVSLTERKS